ncbi:hypothetical protein DAEQUDRAFT_372668 [Daedalea quercina L-15889]|uniref:Uncharacterized protein n=1 Tax=Daedalea quercina L-15889 TaxID=1314783 RepID=A0A165P686_9APHY|nr:hypothetical protein DAEQUDRAFT_372668 [Daedalea quercina L-15889]
MRRDGHETITRRVCSSALRGCLKRPKKMGFGSRFRLPQLSYTPYKQDGDVDESPLPEHLRPSYGIHVRGLVIGTQCYGMPLQHIVEVDIRFRSLNSPIPLRYPLFSWPRSGPSTIHPIRQHRCALTREELSVKKRGLSTRLTRACALEHPGVHFP